MGSSRVWILWVPPLQYVNVDDWVYNQGDAAVGGILIIGDVLRVENQFQLVVPHGVAHAEGTLYETLSHDGLEVDEIAGHYLHHTAVLLRVEEYVQRREQGVRTCGNNPRERALDFTLAVKLKEEMPLRFNALMPHHNTTRSFQTSRVNLKWN